VRPQRPPQPKGQECRYVPECENRARPNLVDRCHSVLLVTKSARTPGRLSDPKTAALGCDRRGRPPFSFGDRLCTASCQAKGQPGFAASWASGFPAGLM
jgi:hypothetical protein